MLILEYLQPVRVSCTLDRRPRMYGMRQLLFVLHDIMLYRKFELKQRASHANAGWTWYNTPMGVQYELNSPATIAMELRNARCSDTRRYEFIRTLDYTAEPIPGSMYGLGLMCSKLLRGEFFESSERQRNLSIKELLHSVDRFGPIQLLLGASMFASAKWFVNIHIRASSFFDNCRGTIENFAEYETGTVTFELFICFPDKERCTMCSMTYPLPLQIQPNCVDRGHRVDATPAGVINFLQALYTRCNDKLTLVFDQMLVGSFNPTLDNLKLLRLVVELKEFIELLRKWQ